MLIEKYNNAVYNALGDVDIISNQMKSDEEIRNVGRIIIKHGYEKLIGVAIAHRHFDLQQDEVMVENETMENDRKVLTTRPHLIDEINDDEFKPTVVVCSNAGVWHPIAYGGAIEHDQVLRAWSDEKFMIEIGNYLIAHKLQNQLCLAVRRASQRDLVDGEMFVERNFDDDRTSVVRAEKLMPNTMNSLLPTLYVFENNEMTNEKWCAYIQTCIRAGGAHISGRVHT